MKTMVDFHEEKGGFPSIKALFEAVVLIDEDGNRIVLIAIQKVEY